MLTQMRTEDGEIEFDCRSWSLNKGTVIGSMVSAKMALHPEMELFDLYARLNPAESACKLGLRRRRKRRSYHTSSSIVSLFPSFSDSVTT